MADIEIVKPYKLPISPTETWRYSDPNPALWAFGATSARRPWREEHKDIM